MQRIFLWDKIINCSFKWIVMCFTSRQHSIGYMGDGFYRSKDPTNSIKVLKEKATNEKIHISFICPECTKTNNSEQIVGQDSKATQDALMKTIEIQSKHNGVTRDGCHRRQVRQVSLNITITSAAMRRRSIYWPMKSASINFVYHRGSDLIWHCFRGFAGGLKDFLCSSVFSFWTFTRQT